MLNRVHACCRFEWLQCDRNLAEFLSPEQQQPQTLIITAHVINMKLWSSASVLPCSLPSLCPQTLPAKGSNVGLANDTTQTSRALDTGILGFTPSDV
jgi:hypothetical protein